MKRFAVYGTGGCARGVLPLVRSQLKQGDSPYELVFVDDAPSLSQLNGHEVLTFNQWLERPATSRHITIAIADGSTRQRLAERCIASGVEFFEARANNVVQMDEVIIGPGAILSPFVTITSNIRIGLQFHANHYCSIEHDCIIGNYVTFAPGVRCNGNVVIEDYVYIGSGALIKQGTLLQPLVIGKGAVVGMGAVVTQNIPAGSIVVGNPAKPLFGKSFGI